MKCESSIFPSKRSKVLEQGYVTKKRELFPNVNFKLIFKLHKASLSANRKDFQRRRDWPPSAQAFSGESYFLPSHHPLRGWVGGYVEIGQ